METSERAKAFLASLDEDALQVGDGSDGKPVWIGVDGEAGRVYKIYATGLAQGFGDGRLDTINGLRGGQRGMQLTSGEHIYAEVGDRSSPGWQGTIYTACPGTGFRNEAAEGQIQS